MRASSESIPPVGNWWEGVVKISRAPLPRMPSSMASKSPMTGMGASR